jgi:hypothetical protein
MTSPAIATAVWLFAGASPSPIPDIAGAYETVARDIALGQGKKDVRVAASRPYCFTFLDKSLSTELVTRIISRVRKSNPRTYLRNHCPESGLVFHVEEATGLSDGTVTIGQEYVGRVSSGRIINISEGGHVTLTLGRANDHWTILDRHLDWIQ